MYAFLKEMSYKASKLSKREGTCISFPTSQIYGGN